MDTDDEYEYEDDHTDDYIYDDDDQDAEETFTTEEMDDGKSDMLDSKSVSETKLRYSTSGKTPKLRIPDGSYLITEYSSIAEIMDALMNEVSSLLDMDLSCTQILLQHTKWNKEKLMDLFFTESRQLLLDAGLDMYHTNIFQMNHQDNRYENTRVLRKIDHINNNTGVATTTTTTTTSTIPTTINTFPTMSTHHDMTSITTTAATTTMNNNTTTSTISSSIVGNQSPEDRFTCRICCDICPLNTAFSLGCHHIFCKDCYSQYLIAQINDGPSCILAHCPYYKCKQAITPSVYSYFLSTTQQDLYEKYKIYVLRNFIDMTKGMKYCPAAGCDKVAVGLGVSTVRCICGSVFCCKCGEQAHEPCTCAQLSEWNEKCMNESETANWILANTKKCPKCSARIEKNQGCNHMNCKLCKYEFCWICMDVWSSHSQSTGGYYKCNKYEATKTTDASSQSAVMKAKAELDRYLHYYQRYHSHDQSLKFARLHLQQVELRLNTTGYTAITNPPLPPTTTTNMITNSGLPPKSLTSPPTTISTSSSTTSQKSMTMVTSSSSSSHLWIDGQFLKQAVDQLIECRRVLKYTYALGYFLTDNTPEKSLFEYQQEMLEKNTEKLHEFTEKPIESIDRLQVINLTRATERFMSELLTTTEGGIVDTSSAVLMSSSPANLSYLSSSPHYLSSSYMPYSNTVSTPSSSTSLSNMNTTTTPNTTTNTTMSPPISAMNTTTTTTTINRSGSNDSTTNNGKSKSRV